MTAKLNIYQIRMAISLSEKPQKNGSQIAKAWNDYGNRDRYIKELEWYIQEKQAFFDEKINRYKLIKENLHPEVRNHISIFSAHRNKKATKKVIQMLTGKKGMEFLKEITKN